MFVLKCPDPHNKDNWSIWLYSFRTFHNFVNSECCRPPWAQPLPSICLYKVRLLGQAGSGSPTHFQVRWGPCLVPTQLWSQCAGRHFRTKLMSWYIGAGQNDRFDVRIQELVSKVQNPRGFLRKKSFLGSIFGFFSCSVAIFAPIFMKFWLQG